MKKTYIPLTMYALSHVGQKTAGDGNRRQNDGKLKFKHQNDYGLYV